MNERDHYLKETSKFEWTLDGIRIEKIILTEIFFGGFSSTRC